MGVLVRWLNNEPTCILVEFDADWFWRDITDVFADIRSLLEGSREQVDMLIDMREVHRMKIGMIMNYTRLLDLQSPLLRRMIFVAMPPFLQQQAFIRRYDRDIIQVNTFDEALDKLFASNGD